MGRLLLIVCLFMGGCGGCGDDSKVGRLPDAPPPPDVDAAIDAAVDAPVDAAPLTVKLTIARNGAPAQAVQVYFQNADNSVVKSVKTDAAGNAEAIMAAGGSVTAINPFTTPPPPAVTGGVPPDELRTFAGVKPGDHLFLSLNDTPGSTSVNVRLPDDGTRFYEINTTCGSGDAEQPPVLTLAAVDGLVTLRSDCTTADFLVMSLNENKGPPIPSQGFAHNDVDVTDDVDFTADPADTFGNLAQVTYHYTSVPDDVVDLSAAHYRTSKNDRMFVVPYGGFIQGVLSPEAETIFPEPALGDAHLGILLSTLSRNTSHAILTWGPNADRYDTDLAKLLPDLVEQPIYQTSMQQVQWEEDAGGATADLTVAGITVVRGVDATRSWRWVIAAPHTADHLQMPTVPDDVDDFMPAEGDTINIVEFINAKVTVESPAATGYDAVRAHILEVEEPVIRNPNNLQPLGNRSVFVTGVQGEVVLVGLPPAGRLKARGMASALRTSWMAASAKALRASTKAVGAKAAPASTKARRAPAAAGAPSMAAAK